MSSIATAAIVVGAVGAGYGAKQQADAMDNAANLQSQSAANQTALQKEMYDTTRADFAPYQAAGVRGLGQLEKFDQFQGVGDMPSYDQTYTQQLGAYEEDPGTKAAKSLGQQDLQRQLNARGLNYGATGASAGAELAQKYDVQGYDKYKAQLSDRYKALQGEYSLRRDKASTGYQQLLDQVKIGQGAASSAGAANTGNAQMGSATLAGLGKSQADLAMAGGANQAQFYSGLGALPGNAVSMANSLNTLGAGSMFKSSQTPYAVNPMGDASMGPWAQGA